MNGLYALKPWYTRRLAVITGRAVRRGMSPNLFTLVGVVAAAAAGVAIWRGWCLMFAGLAALAARTSGTWTAPAVIAVLLAAVAATLPSFASLAAAGAGATRRNGGPLGKTERCAVAVLATALPAWLTWTALALAIGSLVTAVVRLRAAHTELAGATS